MKLTTNTKQLYTQTNTNNSKPIQNNTKHCKNTTNAKQI